MNILKKPLFWGIAYGAALTACTVYILLDAFVIPRTYAVLDTNPSFGAAPDSNGSSYVISQSQPQSDSSVSENGETSTESASADLSEENLSPVMTENSYSDGNITITLNEYRENDTTIYVADIQLTDIQFLKTALAYNTYGKNITQKTSEIAADHNAILAINGDYYSARSGYVIRNGTILRETSSNGSQEDLVIYQDGTFQIIKEADISAQELLNNGAYQVLTFGPSLVTDGTVSVGVNDEVGKAMADNPRTAIGQIDDLHYVMVVADGRTSASTGLSLYQLAQFMQGLGVQTAYNLDGGGSSTMYFNGRVVNNPTTHGNKISERSVSDIVYIG